MLGVKRALAELPEICPSCKGFGKERYTDAAGDSDWRECMICRGLGKVGPIKCTGCRRTIDVDMVHVRMQPHPCCPWCVSGWAVQLVLRKAVFL